MRFLASVLFMVLCFRAATAQEGVRLKDPIPAAEKPYADCFQNAIDALKKIGDEKGPFQKEAKSAAENLGSALGDGRVTLIGGDINGGVGPGVAGAKKELYINRDRFPKVPPCDPCEPQFALLIGTLFHESIHFTQNTTPGAVDTPANKLDNKLKKLERECEAHDKAIGFRRDLQDAMGALRLAHARGDKLGKPAWA